MGRDVEVERIQGALDSLMDGAGCLVLVSGEPGVGKTRLVEELAAMAGSQGAMVAWGRADDVGGAPPYWPWVQLLAGVLEEADQQLIGDALGDNAGPIAALVPEVKEFVAEIAPPPPLDPPAARFRLHAAIAEFLARLGVHRHLVLVLEDLHWADVASLELTRFSASRFANAAVMLVVTYRSVGGVSSEPFDDAMGLRSKV